MTHKLTYTDNYVLVVDDGEIRVGDWVMEYQPNDKDGELHFINSEYVIAKDIQKKVIAHLPLNNAPKLEGVDLLPEFYEKEYVEKLAYEEYPQTKQDNMYDEGLRNGFMVGYQKAKEKYKYKEEDMIGFLRFYKGTATLSYDSTGKNHGLGYEELLEKYAQQPKRPVAFESEMENNQCDGCGSGYPLENGIHKVPYPSGSICCTKDRYNKPKTTPPPDGTNTWMGKYIY